MSEKTAQELICPHWLDREGECTARRRHRPVSTGSACRAPSAAPGGCSPDPVAELAEHALGVAEHLSPSTPSS
jgi:hypothetical protein